MVDKEEVWKTCPEYPFIQANQFGEIRTKDRVVERKDGRKQFVKGRVLKQYLNKRNGYLYVGVSFRGKKLTLRAHRIIASCFLPNPENLPEVNHKDCNRVNNNVDNLEWCTPQYNMAYKEKYGISSKEANKALQKPLFAVNLKTFEVLRFESQREAARQLGVSYQNINKVLKGRRRTAGGYWFTEDESEITKEKIQEIKDGMVSHDGVIAINLKTFETSSFKSQHEAARQLGFSMMSINNVLKGRQKKACGYWFCYADEHAIEKTRVKFGNEVANKVKELINEKL